MSIVSSRARRGVPCAFLLFFSTVSAAGNPVPANQEAAKEQANPQISCWPESQRRDWLEKFRARTHENLCRTVRWFDGLFGDDEQFDGRSFSGKVIVGVSEDERDGFDPRLRIRLKTKLPNVSKRFNAFIGRVEEDSFVSDSRSSGESVVDRSIRSDDDDAEWLIGLGYGKNSDRGFDFSVGAKISSGLNPYAKIRYRYLVDLQEPHYLNLSQTLFWRDDDGYGTTSNVKYSYTLSDDDVIGWDTSAKFTEESDQWESISGLTWYHRVGDRKATALRFFARGEEENPVSRPEYGISFTYRQPVMRPWLILATGLQNKWVKDSVEEPRESVFRLGLQLEMSFGEYYR